MAEEKRIRAIGILGPSGSGKTTLAKYLYDGKLPKPENVSTTWENYNLYNEEEWNNGLCKGLEKLLEKFNIKTIWDSKSHQYSNDYSAEIEILEKYDVIIYMFDNACIDYPEDVESKQYLENVKEELKLYANYYEKNVKEDDNIAFIICKNCFDFGKSNKPKDYKLRWLSSDEDKPDEFYERFGKRVEDFNDYVKEFFSEHLYIVDLGFIY